MDVAEELSRLEILDEDACFELLGHREVGRIAVVVDGFPVVTPVNYRLIRDPSGVSTVVLRTRPHNAVDGALRVAFEVDHIDSWHRTGWSVLVRGVLGHLDNPGVAADDIDPEPWVGPRDAWLVLSPLLITGRRLHPAATEWPISMAAYL